MLQMYNCFCCHQETPFLHEMDNYPDKKLCSTGYLNDKEEQSRWNNQETKEAS